MANLIYRAVTHTGAKTTPHRTAHALIYRGVAHTGLTGPSRRSARTAQMCYRGVPYIALKAGVEQTPSTTRSVSFPSALAA